MRISDWSSDVCSSDLFTTAHNVLANRYREQATRTALLRGEVPEPDADTLSPERITIAQEEYQRVIAAICNLPPRARQAFELNRFSELTYQAIAEHMGISKNSVQELRSEEHTSELQSLMRI